MDTLTADLRAEAIEAELEPLEAHWTHVETFRHADGSATVVMVDEDAQYADPRDADGILSTLINENDRTIDIDSDDAGLREAHDRWSWRGHRDRDGMIDRYVAMFRPDIALYVDYWSAGDSYGWGYVTTEAIEENFPEELVGDRAAYFAEHSLTVQSLFEQEVESYRQWVEGEVYGYIHIEAGDPVVTYGEEGAYVSGYDVDTSESCWGFLGYPNAREIAEQATTSPIVD